jgi:hypothetical protein
VFFVCHHGESVLILRRDSKLNVVLELIFRAKSSVTSTLRELKTDLRDIWKHWLQHSSGGRGTYLQIFDSILPIQRALHLLLTSCPFSEWILNHVSGP